MMRIVAGIFVAASLALAVAADAEQARSARIAAPVVKIERGDACVAPVDEMRRNHMKMLLHQRDRTVRQGLRETQHSLKGCVDCHASEKTGSVLGKEGFCSSCHEFAAVKIDCFECHTPERRAPAAAVRR